MSRHQCSDRADVIISTKILILSLQFSSSRTHHMWSLQLDILPWYRPDIPNYPATPVYPTAHQTQPTFVEQVKDREGSVSHI